MVQENECPSLERHEDDIRQIQKEVGDAKIDMVRVQGRLERVEKVVADTAQMFNDFVRWSRDKEEKREAKDEARDERVVKRFEIIEGKIMLASPVYKLIGNIITLIITGVVLVIVAKSIPDLANFLH